MLQSHYKDTADYYHSDISNEFEPASGEKDDYETVNGPLGFGDGIYLESSLEQCMKKDNYIPATEKCLVSPNSCDDDDEGFSMSIWVNHDVHANTFSGPVEDVDDSNKYKYIISTGGDVNGHPGVAMALQGHFLIVILSTGDFYYKTRVLGQVPAEEWVNIGFVWYKKEETLKVFVNLKEVAVANKKELGSKLLSLYPPELIVGCHKDNDNKTYRNFLDAKFDEVAFWMRPLSSDLNNYEVIAFYGGLDRNGTFDTKKNLEKMLENVNFKNPEQASAAMKYLQEAQSGVMATEASPTASTDTTGSPEDISNMTDPESVEDLKTFIRQLRIIIDEDHVADSMDEVGLEEYLGPSSTLIDMIFGKSKIKIWKALQADPENKIDTYDAANLMHTYLQYQKKAVSNTQYPNGSKPFCVYSTFNQDFMI
ncbi:hypothetical protein Avbf_07531 [Armadillidium vulgare]|nr:hypothetical protein Avbf_07531 [Armadillidium vulgare]